MGFIFLEEKTLMDRWITLLKFLKYTLVHNYKKEELKNFSRLRHKEKGHVQEKIIRCV